MEDSFRLVHDILDEDPSFLEYLNDEEYSEKERIQKQLHDTKRSSIHPENYIKGACNELIHELNQVESELSLYDARKQTKPRRGKSMPSSKATASLESMLAKLENDFKHDRQSHKTAKNRIESRVAQVHKNAMVMDDLHRSVSHQPFEPKTSRGTRFHAPSLPIEKSNANEEYPALTAHQKVKQTEQPNVSHDATATTRPRGHSIQQLREACTTSIENEAKGFVDNEKSKQSKAVDSILERFEIRKRLAVDKLKKDCDEETQDIVEATKTTLTQEQLEELAEIKNEWKARRQRELNELLVQNELRLEREKQHVEEKCRLDSDVKQAALQRLLDVDRARALCEIEEYYETENLALESRMKQTASDELKKRREDVAAALLRRQEEVLQRERELIMDEHTAKERDEVGKLQDALQMGATLRLQQLRARLENQRQTKLEETERTAQCILDRELELVRQQYDAESADQVFALQDRLREKQEREVDSLKKALAIDETRSLNEVTEEMRRNHHQRVQRIRDEHGRQREQRLVQLQQTYEAEYLQRMEVLDEELNNQLTRDMDTYLEERRKAEAILVEERVENFRLTGQKLRRELHYILQQTKTFKSSSNTPKELDTLQSLRATSREVNEWIDTLTCSFEEMADQNCDLLGTVHRVATQLSTWKQKHTAQEELVAKYQSQLTTAKNEACERDQLCRRLYKANEELLKQLPLPP